MFVDGELTIRESAIKNSLERLGWSVAWRGVPSARWVVATKRPTVMKFIQVEFSGREVVEVKSHGPVRWTVETLEEFMRAAQIASPYDSESAPDEACEPRYGLRI